VSTTTGRAAAALVALALLGVGATAAVHQPDLTDCRELVGLSADVVNASASLIEATADHANATTADDRAIARAEADHLLATLDAVEADYAAAKLGCQEVAR
jgi:hypothetical protein